MIRRKLYFAPPSVKSKAYLATVRPILEYGSVCWSPSSKSLNNKLESVNRQVAKFVSNTYPEKGKYGEFSASRLLNSLGWETLETRREQAKLVMAFKILNKLVILTPDTLPRKFPARPTRMTNDSKYLLEEPFARLSVIQNTFFYSVPRLWNSRITQPQANASSVNSFKSYFNHNSI